MDYINTAIEKIDKELKSFKGANKEKAVSKAIADTLKNFCRQDNEFAQAIVQNDKTLSDCCAAVMKGVGNSISDIDVYKKAVEFYFPGAGIEFTMKIDLCASVRGDTAGDNSKVLNFSLDDLFD